MSEQEKPIGQQLEELQRALEKGSYSVPQLDELQQELKVEKAWKTLAPGEFLAKIKLTLASLMITTFDTPGMDTEGRVFAEVHKHIKFLPEGTKFLGYKSNNKPIDLCYEFELKFYNPLFTNIKEVEFQYMRAASTGENGHINEFVLLAGARYFFKNSEKDEGKWIPKGWGYDN